MNQLKVGVLLTYMNQFIQIVVGLVYTPIMLRLLGQNEYGLYQLVASVVAYMSLLSLGFGSSYLRFYARYRAKNDSKEIARLNGMFMAIFLTMSLVTIVVGVCMVVNIEWVFGSGLSGAEYSTAKVLMALMVGNMALSFPSSVFSSYIIAHERFAFQKSLAVVQSILSPFLALPLMLLGYGSVGLVLASTIVTVLSFIVHMWFCLNRLNMRFWFKGFKFALLKEMWFFTSYIFITQIINQVNWNVDKYLLGRLAGPTAVAVYGVGNTLRAMYVQFSTAISAVFIPRVNQLVAEKRNDRLLTGLMAKVGRLQFVVLMLVLSGFVVFGHPFVKIWAGNEYTDSFWVALIIMVSGTIPLIQNLGIEIQIAKNKHKMRSIIYGVVAIGNIVLSIPLIRDFGPVGAAVGTAISLFVGNVIFMNIYYHTRVGLDMVFFWGQILRLIPGLVPSIVFGMVIMKYPDLNSWLALACWIPPYVLVYLLSMWMFGLDRGEKDMFIGPISRILGGRHKCKDLKGTVR